MKEGGGNEKRDGCSDVGSVLSRDERGDVKVRVCVCNDGSEFGDDECLDKQLETTQHFQSKRYNRILTF